MGCFNSIGFVSHIPIQWGDPIVCILLKRNNYEVRGIVNVNDYAKPIFLPLEGTYDDYGGIEDIKRCTNVETIETAFGIGIDVLIRSIQDGDTKDKNIMYCLEHKEVYDLLTSMNDESDIQVFKHMVFNSLVGGFQYRILEDGELGRPIDYTDFYTKGLQPSIDYYLSKVTPEEMSFARFNMSLSRLNGAYRPNNYGHQDLDFKNHKALNALCRDILIKSENKFADEDDYDSDDEEE